MVANASLNEKQIVLLQKCIEDIHKLTDWEQLTHAIVMNAVELTRGRKGLFLVFDQSLKQLIPQASVSMNKLEIKACISEAKSLFLKEENQRKRSLHVNGIYYFPISKQQEFTGVLIIVPSQPGSVTQEPFNLIYFFMQSVPIVLENSRLYLMMQRKSKSLTYMNQLHQLINQYSFKEVLAEIVQKIGNLLHSEMAGIMLYNPDKNELALQKPAFGFWQESIIEEYRVKLTETSNAVNVFLTGIPANTADASSDKRFNQYFVKLYNAKSIITVPLVVDNKRIGIIHAINKKDGHFTQDDLNLLEDIADQLGTILYAAMEMTTTGKADYRRVKIEQYLVKQLIENLIKGKEENLEEATNILNTLQLSLDPRHCFMKVGILGNADWEKEILKEYKKQMVTTISRFIPRALSIDKDGTLIVLTPHEEIAHLVRTAKQLQQELNRIIREQCQNDKLDVYIGIGESVTALSESAVSFQQSNQILYALPKIQRVGHVGYFPACGSWTLLSSLTVQEELVNSYTHYYLQHINNLRDANEIKETLEMYLKYNGHLKQTAEALFIHQNTLKYRIEKIENATGFDLSDSELRLNLNLALRLEQLMTP